MRKIITVLCCLIACVAMWSQQIAVRNFPPSTYGFGRQNWAISQDEAGRMLFGNSRGLLVYDGETWQIAYVPNYSSVRSVEYDSDRHLIFVGASNEFGYFAVDELSQNLVYHSLSALLPEKERFFGEIWNIDIAADKSHTVRFYSKTRVYESRDDLTRIRQFGIRKS